MEPETKKLVAIPQELVTLLEGDSD